MLGCIVVPQDAGERETASLTLLVRCFLVIWIPLTTRTWQVTSAFD